MAAAGGALQVAEFPAASRYRSGLFPALVAALTLAAFLVRLDGLDQSLFGDELLTLDNVRGRGLGGLLSEIVKDESTPPLYFALAWATAKLGDPTVWVRVPSLILGTATVPITYLVGARTVGRAAGLVAATLVAFSPFTVFYGTEARGYATLMFFSVLSTLALVSALGGRRRIWWVVYALSVCAVLYSHYTGVFLLVAQTAWALWSRPDRRRELLVATGAGAVAVLPWLPSYLDQSDNIGTRIINELSPLTTEALFRDLLKALLGHPFVPLRDLPGRIPIIVFLASLAAAGISLAVMRARARRSLRVRGLLEPPGLVLVLAAATPVGLVLYSLAKSGIWLPRNLSASVPAAALAIGWLLTSLKGRPALVAIAISLASLGVGTVKTLEQGYRRAPVKETARLLDTAGGPRDPVVQISLGSLKDPQSRGIEAYLERPHRMFYAGLNDRRAWRLAAMEGRHVLVAGPQVGVLRGTPRPSSREPSPGQNPTYVDPRFRLEDRRIFDGFVDMGVFEYAPRKTPRALGTAR